MSLTGPDILRIACGDLTTSEALPRRGDPAYEEFEFLRTTWEAVQRVGSPSPEEGTVVSVRRDARAAGTRDSVGPDPDVIKAVLAEAKMMSALTAIALQAPGYHPSNEAVTFIQEMARLAGESSENEFASIRAALGKADVPKEGTLAYAEYQILEQALEAIGRLPAAFPRAETILSVESAAAAMHAAETEKATALMRAALGEGDVTDEAKGEVEALRSALDATARVSRPSPSEASIAAVLAEAKRQGRVPVGMLPAKDRPASRPAAFASASRFVWQRWAGVAVVLLASTVALFVTRPWSSDSSGDAQVTAVQQQEEVDTAAEESIVATETEEQEGGVGTRTQPDVASPDMPSGPQIAAVEPPPPASADPAPADVQADLAAASPSPPEEALADVEQVAAFEGPAETDAQTVSGEDISWEAGDDVRTLSVRLQQLREQNRGLEWGGPTVALGEEDEAVGADPGLQTVGVGAVRVSGGVNETTPIE